MVTTARVLLLVVLVSGWSSATADRFSYQLQVEGMVCAYCAYNVSRHLGGIPGVSQESIKVDLAAGVVRFAGDRPVAREAVTTAVESAGFTLTGMQETGGTGAPAAADRGDRVLHLKLDPEAFGAGYGDELLEAVGSALVREGGRLEVKAPEALEAGILKPLLMGRKTAVSVDFEPTESAHGGVTLDWFRASAEH